VVNLYTRRASVADIGCDLLALGVPQPGERCEEIGRLDAFLDGALQDQIARQRFVGKEGESVVLHTHGRLPGRVLLLLGLGTEKDIDEDAWRRAGGRTRAHARGQGAGRVAAFFPDAWARDETLQAFAEGFLLAGYSFDAYKSEKDRADRAAALILAAQALRPSASLAQSLATVEEVRAGVFLARNLVNEPGSVKTPGFLGEQARNIARDCGLSAEIWGRARIDRERLHGLLAVARGSGQEPRFIKMTYRPAGRKPRRKVALVGKGLTFDSGGLSLKTAKAMETMKLDVSGGAAVLATMRVVGRLRPPVQVTAYVPAAENLPGGAAQKPGDVI